MKKPKKAEVMYEVLKEKVTKGGILIFLIVKYDSTAGENEGCLCCGKQLTPFSFGMITIVDEGHAWCYKCAVSRLEYEPDLQDFIKELVKGEPNEQGC